jgi:hypothetical protein
MSTRHSPDPGAVLGALVEILADALVARLRAGGLEPTRKAEEPSGWYDQESAPIARRTYLALCRSGRIPSTKVGKSVLVERRVLDAWISANGARPTKPGASPSPTDVTVTDEELMRTAGFRTVAPPVEAAPRRGRRRRAGRRPG